MVVIVLWALAGVGLVSYGISRLRRDQRIATFGMTVQGTVVGNKSGSKEHSYPVVRYRVGDESFVKVARRAVADKRELGSHMEVRYDPTRPSDAEIDESRAGRGFVLCGAVVLVLLVGYLYLTG